MPSLGVPTATLTKTRRSSANSYRRKLFYNDTFVGVLFRGLNGDRKSSRYRTFSGLENSLLEVNHVTNVATVLNETAAQVGVLAELNTNNSEWSRPYHPEAFGPPGPGRVFYWVGYQKLFLLFRSAYVRGGGLGSSTIFKNLMSPTPRRKWYLTTRRRAH